jgi:hypothetical protein
VLGTVELETFELKLELKTVVLQTVELETPAGEPAGAAAYARRCRPRAGFRRPIPALALGFGLLAARWLPILDGPTAAGEGGRGSRKRSTRSEGLELAAEF